MPIETRQIARLIATDDSGEEFTLLVYRDFVISKDLDGVVRERPDLLSLFTEDREHVNYLAKGEYEVAITGRKLHYNDPNAV
jgi:hypothetical protein